MKLNKNYSAKEIPTQSFEPLPDGWYPMTIETIEKRTSNSGNEYLQITLAVSDGFFGAGRKVFHNLNLWSNNEKALQIAEGQLAQMAEACGYEDGIDDTDNILGREIEVKLGLDKEQPGYQRRNRALQFRSISDVPKVAPGKQAPKTFNPKSIPF